MVSTKHPRRSTKAVKARRASNSDNSESDHSSDSDYQPFLGGSVSGQRTRVSRDNGDSDGELFDSHHSESHVQEGELFGVAQWKIEDRSDIARLLVWYKGEASAKSVPARTLIQEGYDVEAFLASHPHLNLPGLALPNVRPPQSLLFHRVPKLDRVPPRPCKACRLQAEVVGPVIPKGLSKTQPSQRERKKLNKGKGREEPGDQRRQPKRQREVEYSEKEGRKQKAQRSGSIPCLSQGGGEDEEDNNLPVTPESTTGAEDPRGIVAHNMPYPWGAALSAPGPSAGPQLRSKPDITPRGVCQLPDVPIPDGEDFVFLRIDQGRPDPPAVIAPASGHGKAQPSGPTGSVPVHQAAHQTVHHRQQVPQDKPSIPNASAAVPVKAASAGPFPPALAPRAVPIPASPLQLIQDERLARHLRCSFTRRSAVGGAASASSTRVGLVGLLRRCRVLDLEAVDRYESFRPQDRWLAFILKTSIIHDHPASRSMGPTRPNLSADKVTQFDVEAVRVESLNWLTDGLLIWAQHTIHWVIADRTPVCLPTSPIGHRVSHSGNGHRRRAVVINIRFKPDSTFNMQFEHELDCGVDYHLVFTPDASIRRNVFLPHGFNSGSVVDCLLRALVDRLGQSQRRPKIRLVGTEHWPREWCGYPPESKQRDNKRDNANFVQQYCEDGLDRHLKALRLIQNVKTGEESGGIALQFQTLEGYKEEWNTRSPTYGYRVVTDKVLEPDGPRGPAVRMVQL